MAVNGGMLNHNLFEVAPRGRLRKIQIADFCKRMETILLMVNGKGVKVCLDETSRKLGASGTQLQHELFRTSAILRAYS